jgi:hypothetical protein
MSECSILKWGGIVTLLQNLLHNSYSAVAYVYGNFQ